LQWELSCVASYLYPLAPQPKIVTTKVSPDMTQDLLGGEMALAEQGPRDTLKPRCTELIPGNLGKMHSELSGSLRVYIPSELPANAGAASPDHAEY
jgi:hypothetical protein